MMTKKKVLDLLNTLIDDWIDIYGIDDVISHLLYAGATKEDLLELEFDEENIDNVLEEEEE